MLSSRFSRSCLAFQAFSKSHRLWISKATDVHRFSTISTFSTLVQNQSLRRNTASTGVTDTTWKYSTTQTEMSSQDNNSDDLYQPTFEKGDKVQVEIISFGPLGASVDIIAHKSHDPSECIAADEPALGRGLVLQREINYFREKRGGVDIVRYETLPAYVERVREEEFANGKGIEVRLDISLRPIGGKAKALELGDQILEKLNEEGGVLNVGDKSSPEEINQYFPGASKKAFKKAVSGLYKQGLVNPGAHTITSLMKK